MKLVITVTDGDNGQAATVEAVDEKAEQVEQAMTNGHAPIQMFDGGAVPEVLLSMESEVAAGLRRAPGQAL